MNIFVIYCIYVCITKKGFKKNSILVILVDFYVNFLCRICEVDWDPPKRNGSGFGLKKCHIECNLKITFHTQL